MNQADPGWGPSFRGLWWFMIPLIGPQMRARGRRSEQSGLLYLRSIYVGLVTALFGFWVAFTFIAPLDGGDEGWVPFAVAGLGALGLAGTIWASRRPLSTGSPTELARSYTASFFIQVGMSESAALWGLVGVFWSGSLWVYFIGLAFCLIGFWIAAPSRAGIQRRQREVTAAGSNLSLLDALIETPPTSRRIGLL
jgi:hypothetical protein